MKIAWPVFVLDGGHTGIATYVRSMLSALGRLDTENDYEVLLPETAVGYLPKLAENFHIRPSSGVSEHPLLSIAWHNSLLPLYAEQRGYDLVHVPSIRRIPLVKRCPLIATVHDMAPFALSHKYSRSRTFYHTQVLARVIHRCDRIITISQYTKGDITRYTGYPADKIDVIYSGIDPSTYRPVERAEASEALRQRYNLKDPFIVYVSRVEHPGKNHLNLLKAFEAFKQRHDSPHHLVCAGPDWSGAEVPKDYAKDSKVADQVHFLGSIPTEDIVRLYSACDLMVFPSLFEGFGFPLLEAMACGAPAICSNTTSLGELAPDPNMTFDPESPDDICAKLALGLDLPERDAVVASGKKYAASFRWENTAQQVLQVYKGCATRELV